ncbi:MULTISPECIES: restriction endonuclease subunit S [Chryseobacterium]|uniref:restriction endonuclease subunit S n=1 Tax=Chryseobacterium sp. R2A-55 TaxID=2744445 RepID=UPI001F224962|nr:restriction endonuclease subunit S [Chryseobacterium sp. R2A-55]
MREDWIECEIGDVFDVVTGNTPSKANPLLYGGNIPFIKPPEINNKEVEDASEFLTEEGAKVARILPKHSVLITCIGNLGRVAMNSKFEVAFNQQINALKPNKFVYPKYIYYKAQSSNFRNQLEELSTAVTVSLVNKTNFSKVRFPLPPLPEQRAIVKKLESLFSSLDAGVADLKKAQQQLKIYRQAVLKKAFEGEKREQKLINISEAIGGFAFKSPDFVEKGIYQVIRIGNIRPDLIRLDSNPVFVNQINDKIRKYLLKDNDIVISLTGTRNKRDYGFSALVKNENLLLNQRLAAIRFNEDCNPKYYLHYFSTDYFKDDFFSAETGNTGQGNVGMNAIKETLVPFPSLLIQNEIVKQIESRLSVCDSIEQNIAAGLEKAEALRQSILKKAFEGSLLTAQELAECKFAADYEPASVLLERIKAEQKEIKAKPSKKKPRHSVAKYE